MSIIIILLSGLLGLVGILIRLRWSVRQASLDLAAFQLKLEEARIRVRDRAEQAERAWVGFRKFKVSNRVVENELGDICSFYLQPHDGRPLPRFEPGQHLVFKLDVPGQRKQVRRCYSLSAPANEAAYRVSIKRAPPWKEHPPGVSSNYFHDHVQPGTILDVSAPTGDFFVDMNAAYPVVLIAGGVGITPMLSMFEAIGREVSARQVWLFYGTRTLSEVMQGERILRLAKENSNLKVWFCFSNPGEKERHLAAICRAGSSSQVNVGYHDGRIAVEWMQRLLPRETRALQHFFLCGPPLMMTAVTQDLTEIGIPKRQIHFEDFGGKPRKEKKEASGPAAKITLNRSGTVLDWDGSLGDLLTLADNEEVGSIQPGCWRGSCHSCKTALISGKVNYITDQYRAPEEGTILPCVCVPDGDLVLDA